VRAQTQFSKYVVSFGHEVATQIPKVSLFAAESSMDRLLDRGPYERSILRIVGSMDCNPRIVQKVDRDRNRSRFWVMRLERQDRSMRNEDPNRPKADCYQ